MTLQSRKPQNINYGDCIPIHSRTIQAQSEKQTGVCPSMAVRR